MTTTDLKKGISTIGGEIIENESGQFFVYKGAKLQFFPEKDASSSLQEFLSFKKERDAFLNTQSATAKIMHENGLSNFHENDEFHVTVRLPGIMDQIIWAPKCKQSPELFEKQVTMLKMKFGL